jgi:hypothetical protein
VAEDFEFTHGYMFILTRRLIAPYENKILKRRIFICTGWYNATGGETIPR